MIKKIKEISELQLGMIMIAIHIVYPTFITGSTLVVIDILKEQLKRNKNVFEHILF